jgi:PIN domain nuclease of toxin-antitoxin system
LSVLIDTHVFLLFQTGSPRLSRRVRGLIEDSNQTVYLSAASFWEIAIKRRAGKLAFDGPLRAAAADSGLVELDIEAADGETAGALDWSHRDPFDRLLVAQCLNRSMTLVTADAKLRERGDIAILWAT